MSDAQSAVRVEYRHALLAEQTTMEETADGLFLALDQPMPVRSTLRVITPDGVSRGVVVERVAETSEPGGRGVFARFVDDDTVTSNLNVGSEHLESAAVEEDEGSAPERESDGTNAAVAMPAPVLVDDSDPDEDDADSDSDSEGNGADASESSDGDDKPRGKKRRSRKRR
jgi:hypothetical protein